MTSFQIKLLAMVSMICDHVGLFLFPQVLWLRVVGRLAFPLFAWGIANGARHTSNEWRYVRRLLVFGLISQLPYWLVFDQAGFEGITLNVFFTLGVGLLGIIWARNYRDWWKKLCVVLVVAGVTELIGTDFGGYGVLMIAIFYFWYGRVWWGLILQLILVVGLFVIPGVVEVLLSGMFSYESFLKVMQLVSLGGVGILASYRGVRGGMKFDGWLYWVYPVHLFIIWSML